MHRYQQAAALVFLAFSAFIVWTALKLQYYTPLGPGAGFFAVWLGAILGVLALVQLIQATRSSRLQGVDPAVSVDSEGEAEQAMPDRHGVVRIGATIGALVLTALLLPLLGFQVTVFLLLVFLLLGMERVRTIPTLLIALAFSVGLFQVLTRYLDVDLPHASLTFLKQLGL